MIAAMVVAILACAALAYVAAPLRGRDEPVDDDSLTAELAGRKRAALTAILDMEDERDAGKLSADDFAVLRSEYEAEAATALLELDAMQASAGDELEAEIAAIRTRLRAGRLGGTPEQPAGRLGGTPEQQRDPSHARRAADPVEPCPSCGTPRVPGRTCERCGA